MNMFLKGGDPESQGEKEVITKIQFHDTKTKKKKTKVGLVMWFKSILYVLYLYYCFYTYQHLTQIGLSNSPPVSSCNDSLKFLFRFCFLT